MAKERAWNVTLVCDVGGGTTDLSLIRAEEEDGELILRRLAVGNRLLPATILISLAHRAAGSLRQGVELNPWQSSALQRQCRGVRRYPRRTIQLSDSYKISILGRSSKLVGESVSILFPKADAIAIALEGFFPKSLLTDRPKRRSGMGLREAGLPYESDAAIMRHVAAFLNSKFGDSDDVVKPTRFLLNGGVFKSKLIEARFEEQLGEWYPDVKPTNLSPDANLESAVACGAAYYGSVKHGSGVRIRGASPRSYYIGIETAAPAIPGVKRPLKALCVSPMGMEEGSECEVPSEPFELLVGEPATFRFFSSTTRPQDRPGVVVDWFDPDEQGADSSSDLHETDPIETRFDSALDDESETLQDAEPEYVAVKFHTGITELGAMEIWCDEVDGSRSWTLQFSVREE